MIENWMIWDNILKEEYLNCLKNYLNCQNYNALEGKYQILITAIKNVFDYLCNQDFYDGNNKASVFKCIYIDRVKKKLYQIAHEYHMDDKILYNHRLVYNQMIIDQCIKQDKHIKRRK